VEGAWGGAPSLETLEGILRKSPDAGISVYRGSFITEGNLVSGGNFERWMKEGSRNGLSFCKGLHEGDLDVGLLYWGTQDMLSKARKWVSVSVETPLRGTWMGSSFLGPSY